jgi:precorrin-6B methylase 1
MYLTPPVISAIMSADSVAGKPSHLRENRAFVYGKWFPVNVKKERET